MFPRVKPPSTGADEGWAVLGSLMSGLVLLGAPGWLLDQWWDIRVMAPIGAVVGMALGIYAVVMRHAQRLGGEQVPAEGVVVHAGERQMRHVHYEKRRRRTG